MPRQPRQTPESHVPTAILDSEAVAALAQPKERGSAARRAQAVLEVVERLGGYAIVPAPVVAEVSRGPRRRAAVDHVLNRLPVVATDRAVAQHAGALLQRHSLGSEHAIDAFVVATAARAGSAVILTADADDLGRLASGNSAIAIHGLT